MPWSAAFAGTAFATLKSSINALAGKTNPGTQATGYTTYRALDPVTRPRVVISITIGAMIQRILFFLLIVPVCLAQTNQPPTASSQPDDINAISAQANQGNPDAQIKLADAYLRGRGVTENDAEGFRWFLAAAEKGNAEAQYSVGSLYAIGKGVNSDDAEASKWFLESAENGNATAQYDMGVRCANGRGVPKDNQQAASWFRKSADQGLAIGQAGLAAGYLNGLGLPQDKAEAFKW